MSTPTVNFLSYNSTGLNTMKSKWLRDLMDISKIDFCSIQEHFKKNIGKFFADQFDKFHNYVIPAVREKDVDNGRPKGGIAQLSSNKYKIKTVRLPTKNFILQAQLLYFPNRVLLWINAYFPTDPQTISFNDEELSNLLQEAEAIMDHSEFDHVILAGDLNWDPNRNSGFSIKVRDFFNRIGLISVWEKFPVTHTHIHTDMKSMSTLDHFMIDPGLLPAVADAGALHLGCNLSRHSPIMIKLDIGSLPSRTFTNVRKPKRQAWYKADEEHKEAFCSQLEDKLSSLTAPSSLSCSDPLCKDATHTEERDSYVLDVMSSLIEVSHLTIPMAGGGKVKPGAKSIACPVTSNIPGWELEVLPYKEDAVFWHSIWVSAERPTVGALRDLIGQNQKQVSLCY